MDTRRLDGLSTGGSRAGRALLGHLLVVNTQILAAGASDWVVVPGLSGYPADEAYFLHFIVHTIYQAQKDKPELDLEQFEKWICQRHDQIDKKELVYIAHQLDYVGIIQRN